MKSVCELLKISPRTERNWRKSGLTDRRTLVTESRNPIGYTEEEKDAIVARFSRDDVVDKSLTQAYYFLLDKGEYYCSERTLYRIFNERSLNKNRTPCKPRKVSFRPTTYEAVAPNQVWTWDITYFRNSQYSDRFFYAAVAVDIYSRRIMNAKVYEADTKENAVDFLSSSFDKYGVVPGKLVLHSDNGASMKAAATMDLLKERGVTFSHSRPRVSNDNPFSESLFRTLKYSGYFIYPRAGFASKSQAQQWLDRFVEHYNTVQRHSGIRMVTPQQRYDGADTEVLARRKETVELARAKNPGRWIQGKTLNCIPVGSVFLNPENIPIKQEKMAA
jgi:transposase InsO family protein